MKQASISRVLESIEECLAAGYVNLREGVVQGAQIGVGGEQPASLCAAAARDLLETVSVGALESLFRNGPVTDVRPTEVILLSVNHLYVVEWSSSDRALVAVCRGTADLSRVIMGMRAAIVALEQDRACTPT